MAKFILGQSYFPSILHAFKYYECQYEKEYVEDMVINREISIGIPYLSQDDIKNGAKIILLDNGLRYGIEFL